MKNLFILILFLASSCAVHKNYNPLQKFSSEELQEDYRVFRNVLEESHPSLYWYTPKDSMDLYFSQGEALLRDSMPEYKFRYVLSSVLSQIKCGHTTVRASKDATRYAERTRGVAFPLSIKAWDDTVVVTSNLSRKDSVLMRGALLTSINNRPISTIVDSLFRHLSTDGYNLTHKYQTLSNGGTFRNLYGGVYGLQLKTPVEFIDTAGIKKSTTLGLYAPVVDSTRRRMPRPEQPSKRERKKMQLENQRNMRVDKSLNTAFLEVNGFSRKYRLRSFLRRSFKQIRRENISNLVVDMRGNGGGSVVLSNLLTRYIADQPFKIADSLFAIRNKSSYKKYQNNYLLNRLFFIFMTRKKKDGLHHFSFFENKYFRPRKKNHYEGFTYILTGGNTFSAASLFTKALKGQPDVLVVGEETGGGAYGNSAWLIPEVTLPETGVRFRLPLFRLVIDKNEVKGAGVLPDIEAKPTVEAIRKNRDYKMEKVIQLIKEKKPS